MSPRVFVGLVGAVAILVGLFLASQPIIGQNNVGANVTCGTAFAPLDTAKASYNEDVNSLAAAMRGESYTATNDAGACTGAIGARQGWSWGLAGVGLLGVLGALLIRTRGVEAAESDLSRVSGTLSAATGEEK